MQGVGKFYEPFAAQKIFDDYNDLEIAPIFFPAFFYCRKFLTFTNPKVCPHDEESREQISGTKMRSLIQEGKAPSEIYSTTRSCKSHLWAMTNHL